MKYSEIKDLTVEELKKRMVSLRENLFETKMKHSLGQLSNTDQIRQARRDMAKVNTALHAKLAR